MQATAAIIDGFRDDWVFRDVTVDDPVADEVLVRVVACGICHTDLAARDGHLPVNVTPPAVLGHEGAGVVEAVGPEVQDIAVGDHVVMTMMSCGRCPSCLTSHPLYCEHYMQLNFSGTRIDGTTTLRSDRGTVSGSFFQQSSFATHAIATQRNVVKVSKDLDLAALGPLGCSIQTGAGTVMEVLAPEIGSTLAVFGAGSVGLAAVMAAKVERCAAILAVDIHDNRLALARELGATHTLNPMRAGALAPEIRRLVGGLDHVVDTTALPSSIEAAVACLNPRGRIAMVGVARPEAVVPVPMMGLFLGQSLTGVVGGDVVPRVFIPKLIELWRAGEFPFERIIRFYDFRDINKAIADSVSGTTLKPVLRIGTA